MRDNFSSDAPHMRPNFPEPMDGPEAAAWTVAACGLLALVIAIMGAVGHVARGWWQS